jgi:hypothetical protein
MATVFSIYFNEFHYSLIHYQKLLIVMPSSGHIHEIELPHDVHTTSYDVTSWRHALSLLPVEVLHLFISLKPASVIAKCTESVVLFFLRLPPYF